MTVLRNFALLMVGYVFAFYAGFCLLGGPDGTVLSRGSFLFGVPSLLISVLLVFACIKLAPLRGYAFAPLLVVIIAWLFSVAEFHKAGFNIWLFGTVASSFAGVVYWALIQFSMRRS